MLRRLTPVFSSLALVALASAPLAAQTFSVPIADIQCADWSLLRDLHSKVKKRITADVRGWITLNEESPDKYQERLEGSLEISIPIDDGPERGQSVFAKKSIDQYEVVCPYAGGLHRDEDSLGRSIKKQGSQRVLSYLFGVRSGKRSLDGHASGNVASVVNTSQLKDGSAFKENNLIPVIFGKNLVFYIALRDIQKGEELFVDYGPNYNPMQLVDIKEETPIVV